MRPKIFGCHASSGRMAMCWLLISYSTLVWPWFYSRDRMVWWESPIRLPIKCKKKNWNVLQVSEFCQRVRLISKLVKCLEICSKELIRECDTVSDSGCYGGYTPMLHSNRLHLWTVSSKNTLATRHKWGAHLHPPKSATVNIVSMYRFYSLVFMPYLLNAVVLGKSPFYFSRSRCSEDSDIVHKPTSSL